MSERNKKKEERPGEESSEKEKTALPIDERHASELAARAIDDPDAHELRQLSREELLHCIKSIESRSEYQHYKETPRTFKTLESLLDDFDEAAEGLNGKEIQDARVELKRRVGYVIRVAKEYAASLLSLEYSKMHDHRLPTDKYLTRTETRVREHSKVHMELIKAATELNMYARSLARLGIVLPEEKLFTSEETNVETREVIGAWAFYAERGSRMEEVLKLLRERVTEEKHK